APHYGIEVVAEDYKKAEAVMKEVAETALKSFKSLGGHGSFIHKR
ncbi:MAG: translation initiation factor IF-2 subunit alpha, partial [Thermoprotei archaeon]